MISLRSDLRRKLLAHFYANRAARAYVRQLAALLNVDSTNLSRELARLEREGFLRSEVEGRNRYYSISPRYPHLEALFALLQGSVGLIPTLAVALRDIPGVEQAYLYGSFAKNEADAASDIDLLIIGSPDAAALAVKIAGVEKVLSREINYTVMASRELRRKLKAGHPVLTDIWESKRPVLFPGGPSPDGC